LVNVRSLKGEVIVLKERGETPLARRNYDFGPLKVVFWMPLEVFEDL